MKKAPLMLMLLIVTAAFAVSCSNNAKAPNIPTTNDQNSFVFPSETEQEIIGAWTCIVNPETLEFNLTPLRESSNFNFTSYLSWCQGGCYQIFLKSSENNLLHLRTQMTNPTNITPYDVRVIFTNLNGKIMIAPDGYTNLFDPPGDEPINPFYYYYTSGDPQRRFPAGPGSSIARDIDVSIANMTKWEFNIIAVCGFSHIKDVVQLTKFETNGKLTSKGGSMLVSAELLDWQNDITAVSLWASELEGANVNLSYNSTNGRWEGYLYNSRHKTAGIYKMLLFAYSPNPNSAAYFQNVAIEVGHEVGEEKFVHIDPQTSKVFVDWSDLEGTPYGYNTEYISMFPYLCGNKDYVYTSSLNYTFGRVNYLHRIGGETKQIMILGNFGGASNDGSTAVYGWNNQIWLSKQYGNSLTPIPTSTMETDPCISGNASVIAYITFDNASSQIAYRYLSNINTEFYAGTAGTITPAKPVMTYDGTLIFCMAKVAGDTAYDVYKYTIATNLFEPVDVTPNIEEKNIQCSRDGKKLIFLRESAPDSYRYNVFTFKDDVIDEFIQLTNDAGGDVDYLHPDINENGTMVLYTRFDYNLYNGTYYISDFSGLNQRVIKSNSFSLPMTFNAY